MSTAVPPSIAIVELRELLPSIEAGARALRERQRWAARVTFLPTDAEHAAEAAARLEALASRIDGASGEGA